MIDALRRLVALAPWPSGSELREHQQRAVAAVKLLFRRVEVAPTPCDVIYRSNKLKLLRYRRPGAASGASGPPGARAPILCVPSLINRHYVLDLMPERTLVGYLVEQGHEVLMIDWGKPGPEDRFVPFDDYIDGLMHRAVARAARLSSTRQVTLLGYCMGGTLSAIYAAAHPDRVAALVNLAAPIDFSEGGLLKQWTERQNLDADRLVDALGNVPWPLLQASFHLLVPTLIAQKAIYLYDRLTDDRFLDHFLALERWSNDNVAFPGECFRRYIKDLYQENLLVRGQLTINGRRADLSAIRCPVLNVVSSTDHIVPPAAARPLGELVGTSDYALWELTGGHIGAIVSRTAARTFWPRLNEWLQANGG